MGEIISTAINFIFVVTVVTIIELMLLFQFKEKVTPTQRIEKNNNSSGEGGR